MQITKRLNGKIVELLVEGRMDVHWSEHLAAAVRSSVAAPTDVPVSLATSKPARFVISSDFNAVGEQFATENEP